MSLIRPNYAEELETYKRLKFKSNDSSDVDRSLIC